MDLLVSHIAGDLNVEADTLSRRSLSRNAEDKYARFRDETKMVDTVIPEVFLAYPDTDQLSVGLLYRLA